MTAAGLVADDGELFDLLVGGPVGVADVELTEGLATLRRTVGPPCSGRTLFVLARLHSHPIGCLALADDAESPERDWVVAVRQPWPAHGCLREQQDRCCHHYYHPRHRRPRVNRADYRSDDHDIDDYGTADYGTADYDVRPCRGLLLARRCN